MTRTRLLIVVSVLTGSFAAGCGHEGSAPPGPQTFRLGPMVDPDYAGDSGGSASIGEATAESSSEMAAEAYPSARPDAAGYGSAAEAPAERADPASTMPIHREESAPRRRMQSGLLTAGSIDDHAAFDQYQQFLNDGVRGDPYFARLPIGQRVVIEVKNSAGAPVGDARVVVQADDQQSSTRPLVDLTTGSDGRTVWLTGIDGGAASRDVLVTVHPPGGDGEPVSERLRWDQQPWQIELPDVQPQLPVQLDLALVIDTTGSMGDELEYLKTEIDDIAATIHHLFPNVDQRYALIVYRDQGDEYVTRSYGFTDSLSEFRGTLAAQRASGGGDYPEAVHVALQGASQLDWRSRDTARVLFLVGDAPPHDADVEQTFAAAKSLRRQGVRVFPVAGSGAQWKAEFILRATSFLTIGKYLFLTDHSGVGAPHAEPHVPSYQVEHLNRLMVRMVAEQLAGRTLAASEILSIENGQQHVPLQQQTHYHQQTSIHTCPATPVSCVARPQTFWSWCNRGSARWLLLGLVLCGAFVVDFLSDRRRRD